MCLGLPLLIVEIDKNDAVGEMNGVKRRIRIDLLSNLSVGDYVMVHAGFAIQKLEKEFAMQTIDIVNELEELTQN
jgi:hydrogenase expression/formation protein HypC